LEKFGEEEQSIDYVQLKQTFWIEKEGKEKTNI
jgi:hypothetical protein